MFIYFRNVLVWSSCWQWQPAFTHIQLLYFDWTCNCAVATAPMQVQAAAAFIIGWPAAGKGGACKGRTAAARAEKFAAAFKLFSAPPTPHTQRATRRDQKHLLN
jgi:hypothetical protein